MGSRSGSTLIIVLAFAILLSVQIYILMLANSSSYKHLDRVNANLRAIYTAEAALSRIQARLKSRSWADRWFKDSPVTARNQTLEGGTFTSYVATVPDLERKLADVWIEARYEGALVAMFWRLRYLDNTLDFYAQVQPLFFTFLSGEVPPPTSPEGAQVLGAVVEKLIEAQKLNQKQALTTMGTLNETQSLKAILETLKMTEPGRLVDRTLPVGPDPPVPQPSYLAEVKKEQVLSLLFPNGPSGGGTGVGMGLAQQFPTPRNFTQVIGSAFNQMGLPPAQSPTSDHFADPARAATDFGQAVDQEGKQNFMPMMKNSTDYLKNMAQKYDQNGCPECFDALDSLLGYLEQVTQRQVAAGVGPPPDPDRVDPRPYTAASYGSALMEYRDWWNRYGRL